MKPRIWVFISILWCGMLAGETLAATSTPATAKPLLVSGKSPPGVEAAQALATITGVAISPLLGVSAVGAWQYFKAPPEKRPTLPWFAQPYFWIPALLLVLAVFVKDAAGTAMPVALKKPFDVLEVFENKVSALIVAGAFVPLIAAIFGSSSGDGSMLTREMGLAMIDPSPVLNALMIPFAIVIFFIVWLVSHVINVLILISPFGVVDAALKSARLFVLSTLTVASLAHPYLGAALSLMIIVICYFLAGWSFRMSVLGTVFAWDLLTMRQARFKPRPSENWMFTALEIGDVPVRTYGKLSRDEQGQLVLTYRPLLVLRSCRLVLPKAEYVVGRGLVYPELLQVEGERKKTIFDLPPRYRTHEAEVAGIYQLGGVYDLGMVKGLKAVWRWMKDFLAFGVRAILPKTQSSST